MEKLTLDRLPRKVLKQLDLETCFMASRLVLAAERLQVFRRLQGRKLAASALGRMLKLHPRYSEDFLNALVSLGLLRKRAGLYSNSRLAEKYYIRERSIYWTRQYSVECVQDFEALTVLEKVLSSGRDYWTIMGKSRPDYVESMMDNPRHAEDFTRMLFHLHRQDAEAVAAYLDLSSFRAVLDVGGGSGVMSMGLAQKNPHIRATVLDIEPVCRVAMKIIRKEGLSRRVTALAGDMHEGFPPGYDVIMLCDIGLIETGLLKKAYRALLRKGMVVLVDRFLSEDRTDPLDRLLHRFTGSHFPMDTRLETVDALRTCGFGAVKKRNVYDDVWVITGRKVN